MKLSQLISLLSDDVLVASDGFTRSLVCSCLEPQCAETEFSKRVKSSLAVKPEVSSEGLATITIRGAMAHNPDALDMFFNGTEDSGAITDSIMQCANDRAIRGVMLDVDSPGGMFTGGPEMSDAVAESDSSKPTIVWTGGSLTSLGYMLAAPARVIIASQSSRVGGIGTFLALPDVTKMLENLGIKMDLFKNSDGTFKAIGVPGVPLTDAQRAHLQSQTDSIHSIFANIVTTNRPDVKPESMKGQTFTGLEAQKVGLVDAIGSRAYALGVLRQLASQNNK